jgi:hypothetical protein
MKEQEVGENLEDLRNLYSPPNVIVKEDEMGRACSTRRGEEVCIH